MNPDVIVVGAGVAGLAAARELKARGRAPIVLERARGVGGRCATRRVEGQPVDHGLTYLHGRGDRFLAELASVAEGTPLRDWPRAREGGGVPCRPEAFEGADRRLVFTEGVSRFPKHLARGLDVRVDANVAALRAKSGARATGWDLVLASGEVLSARDVVLALPAPSSLALLESLDPMPEPVRAVVPVLGLVRMLPCLTVLARYPEPTPPPSWEAAFPAACDAVHAIFHDSSKRARGAALMLVIQARPSYSIARMSDPAESWTRHLLERAADLQGGWIASPELVQSHVWRKARVDPGAELVRPIVTRLESGATLSFCGDGFHHAGGVEGAYQSGIALASRLVSPAAAGAAPGAEASGARPRA